MKKHLIVFFIIILFSVFNLGELPIYGTTDTFALNNLASLNTNPAKNDNIKIDVKSPFYSNNAPICVRGIPITFDPDGKQNTKLLDLDMLSFVLILNHEGILSKDINNYKFLFVDGFVPDRKGIVSKPTKANSRNNLKIFETEYSLYLEKLSQFRHKDYLIGFYNFVSNVLNCEKGYTDWEYREMILKLIEQSPFIDTELGANYSKSFDYFMKKNNGVFEYITQEEWKKFVLDSEMSLFLIGVMDKFVLSLLNNDFANICPCIDKNSK